MAERHVAAHEGSDDDWHEFRCDDCGWHLLFPTDGNWTERIVLNRGDESALHSASTTGVTLLAQPSP